MHTLTCTHTCTRCMCTHIHANAHTSTCTCAHTSTHHIHTHAHTCTHTFTHSYTSHVHTHAYTYTCTHTCTHSYTSHVHTHAYTYTHAHHSYTSHVHTHAYTYTHAHTIQTRTANGTLHDSQSDAETWVLKQDEVTNGNMSMRGSTMHNDPHLSITQLMCTFVPTFIAMKTKTCGIPLKRFWSPFRMGFWNWFC